MKCGAARWFGDELKNCDYEHAHGGVCSWHAFSLTDAQLRAECERRFAGPVNEYTRLRKASDEAIEVLTKDRDEWKRRAEAAEELVKTDYWQKRAIEAEDKLRGAESVGFMRGQAEMRERWSTFNAREIQAQERGPGISATPAPDTGHYVDPWDFLEDA